MNFGKSKQVGHDFQGQVYRSVLVTGRDSGKIFGKGIGFLGFYHPTHLPHWRTPSL